MFEQTEIDAGMRRRGLPRVQLALALAAAVLGTGCGEDYERKTAEATATITVTGVNDAPEIQREAPIPLTPADLYDTVPVPIATPVSYLVRKARVLDVDRVPGPDPLGIAVVDTAGADGRWEFSTDSSDGSNGAWQAIGVTGPTQARVLGPAAWVRFIPPPRGRGGKATIAFRAWDGSDGQRSGSAGVDVAAHIAAHGMAAAYSARSARAEHAFVAVDDPPQARNDDATQQPALNVAAGTRSGNLRSALLANDGDPDPGDAGRFGIVSINTNGTIGRVYFDPGGTAFGDETITYQADAGSHRQLAAGATQADYFRYTVMAAALNPTVLKGEQAAAIGDFNTAVIYFKNAVQADPENPRWRVALGEFQLDVGNPKAALKEMDRARKLGRDDDDTNRHIALASILSGELQRAAEEIQTHGDLADPDWGLVQVRLDLANGQPQAARAALDSLLAARPEDIESLRALIQSELDLGAFDAARAAIARLLALRPDDVPTLLVRAGIDLRQTRAADARDGFEQVLALRPGHYLARLGLATALLDLEQSDRAVRTLDALGKAADQDPRALALRARLAEQQEQLDTALVHWRSVLQRMPGNRTALGRAADLSYRTRDYRAAEGFLGRLIELDPENQRVRAMYGVVLMHQGKREFARDVLGQDASLEQSDDPELLALLGMAYLRAGDAGTAANSLARAATLAPESLPIRMQLARSKLESGQAREAAADFAAIRADAPEAREAAVYEILALAAAGEPEQALERADAFTVDAGAAAPLPWNLRGYLRARSGDHDGAQQDFERALAERADFHPARINLARLAMQRKDPAAAHAQLDTILAQTPHQLEALLMRARLAVVQGDRDAALAAWTEAVEHHPRAVQPRILLARELARRGRTADAAAQAQTVLELAPDRPSAQYEYARTMLLAGRHKDALPVAEALHEKYPEAEQVLVLLGALQQRARDRKGLEASLEKLAEVAPQSPLALVAQARLALAERRFADAEGYAKQLVSSAAGKAAGHELSGDIAALQGDAGAAADAYAEAFALVQNTGIVVKLDSAEQRAGRDRKRLLQWVQDHPDDAGARFVLASRRHRDGAGDEAIALYQGVLAQQPEHGAALNNLAWLYHERGDARALALAEKAYAGAGSNAMVADTYGWILLGLGKREQALPLLEKARELAPRNPVIGVHLARAQAAVGARAGARATLDGVLAGASEFPGRAEAEQFRRELGD